MLKTKCLCGARFEYEAAEAGQTVTCDCGKPVLLIAPPPPAPSWFCGKCAAKFPEGTGRQWRGMDVCKKCLTRFEKDEEDRQVQIALEAQRQARQETRQESQTSPPPALPPAPPGTPSYSALAIVSAILRASGIAMLLLCIVSVGLAFSHSPPSYPVLAAGLSSAVSGLLLLAAAEALSCLRDIAINSFRH